MNDDNHTPNPIINNSEHFKQFFTFSKNQYSNLIKLKKLYFEKVMLDKIQKQVRINVENMEYIKNQIFPVETSFVNSMGEKVTLNFEDIISFKSNIKNNKIHQKELNQKLTSLDLQIRIIEEELKYLINRSDKNFDDKFRKMTLESINEEDLLKIFKINKSIGIEIKNLDSKLQNLKMKIETINRRWRDLEYRNNIFLKELTVKLNDRFNEFKQQKELKYFLNQNNFSGNRLTGSDQIFFSILQKLVFYEEIENQSINFKMPIVIDTPNKEDLSEINWKRMEEIIDTISLKTQLIVMTTKEIKSKINFNNIDLFNKKPRELLKNNDISKVPDKISELSKILLEI